MRKLLYAAILLLSYLPLFAGEDSGGLHNLVKAELKSESIQGNVILASDTKILYLDSIVENSGYSTKYISVSSEVIATISSTIGQGIVYTFEDYGISGEWLPVLLESVE